MSLIRCKNGHLFSERRYGKICPYCNIATGKEIREGEDPLGQYTDTEYLEELEALYPVVGWLVCIAGPSKGKDYRIIAEKNFIGRSPQMDIRILGDNHIAVKNHAIIAYDPKKRETLLLPGDSQGLVYLDGTAIYSPQVLAAFDQIELGKSKFVYIPLCGEHFEWEEINE